MALLYSPVTELNLNMEQNMLRVLLIVCLLPLSLLTHASAIDNVAERFVTLSLAAGEHDADFVDAYFGPESLKPSGTISTQIIIEQSKDLMMKLEEMQHLDNEQTMRARFLRKHLLAMIERLNIVEGNKQPFDVEAQRLYDATTPAHDRAYFEAIIADIDQLLPGNGSTAERINAFREQFVIPTDKLQVVFNHAIAACREKTLAFIELPANESFTMEFVGGKPWSGYNWYQGNYHSLIQVNTELPIQIDRAVDLGCHEGYPGHHTFNVLRERDLVNTKGWIEFSVYPLFSPASFIAEGSANFGIDMAFPGDERLKFERDVLYPLAGLDKSQAEAYHRLRELMAALNYAGNEAARHYLNGEWDEAAFREWMINVALYPAYKTEQRQRFVDTYRSYVINYNLGRDMVANYVDKAASVEQRWQRFSELLASPLLASDL